MEIFYLSKNKNSFLEIRKTIIWKASFSHEPQDKYISNGSYFEVAVSGVNYVKIYNQLCHH